MAGFTSPYRYHNFIGDHVDAAAATTFFQTTLGWGTLGAGVGLGVSYWDTTDDLLKVWNGTTWAAMEAATPTLSEVLTAGADAGATAITNLGAPTNSTDAATKGYVDSVASGLMWKPPVLVLNMVSDFDYTSSADPTGMVAGDCYVVKNWLTGGFTNGDIVEYSGTVWVLIQAATVDEPADGTRVIVKATGGVASFLNQGDKIGTYNATTDIWAFEAPADGWASLIIGDGGIWADTGWTYNGTAWVQFTGAGQINAGAGLTKDGNTLNVGKGDGIAVGADSISIDLYATNPGLTLVGTSPDKELSVLTDGAHGIITGASGVEIELAATAAKGGLVVDSDGVRSMQFNAGNPNGVVTGVLGEFCLDTTSKVLYVCMTAGTGDWNVV